MPVFANDDIPAKTSKTPKDGFVLVSSVAACDPRYWVRDGKIIREMTGEEKAVAYPVAEPSEAEKALSELSQRDDSGADIRVLEDVISALIGKGVLDYEDLPVAARNRLEKRSALRQTIRGE